jgi:5-formyltetrahydrofolate cyclo-ligase
LLRGSRLLTRARHIAVYWPSDGELDPWPVVDRMRGCRRRWYLPVLRPHTAFRLWFVRYRPGDRLRANRYGIPEPIRRRRDIHSASGLDAVLMPLVGFDAQCNRVGMGAGFYDRSLAFLRGRLHWRRPRLIGLAHECQLVERLDPRPWDVPLDAVVTEERVYRRRPASRKPSQSRPAKS